MIVYIVRYDYIKHWASNFSVHINEKEAKQNSEYPYKNIHSTYIGPIEVPYHNYNYDRDKIVSWLNARPELWSLDDEDRLNPEIVFQ